MDKIGIFFGTETGSTRLVAKKIQKALGDKLCDKPVNVNRITPADMLHYDALILGTPSYGDADIPGKGISDCVESNWVEFLAQLPDDASFAGKTWPSQDRPLLAAKLTAKSAVPSRLTSLQTG